MDKTYAQSIREHVEHIQFQLDQLAVIASKAPLNQFESLAAERLLQILIEACIGVAKHWVKHKGLGIAHDAYASFVLLEQNGEYTSQELSWRKIIGMRNALVHDYLNIDTDIILDVIRQQRYKQLVNFVDLGLTQITQPKPSA